MRITTDFDLQGDMKKHRRDRNIAIAVVTFLLLANVTTWFLEPKHRWEWFLWGYNWTLLGFHAHKAWFDHRLLRATRKILAIYEDRSEQDYRDILRKGMPRK